MDNSIDKVLEIADLFGDVALFGFIERASHDEPHQLSVGFHMKRSTDVFDMLYSINQMRAIANYLNKILEQIDA